MAAPPTVPEDGMRINKYLSRAGVCSRRDADTLVEARRVAINGEPVTSHGTRVYPGDTVAVDGDAVALQEKEYLVLNKPAGCITTVHDDRGRQTVMDVIGRGTHNPAGIAPVGRLDRNTTGILLLTNDGDLAHRLMHPRYEIDKVYFVQTAQPVKPHQLDRLRRGVDIGDARLAQAADVAYLQPPQKDWIALKLHEGRNRQIRRMCKALGHTVKTLDRVQFAGITLEGLERGAVRPLTEQEIADLRNRVS
ncbi:MAG: pseudouridine synthase [Longimonas sp.]|uniref:pseudouridine synthase n=1 Tax=Longimonas sp. TaxID=2039626 RepID=UPI003352AFA0